LWRCLQEGAWCENSSSSSFETEVLQSFRPRPRTTTPRAQARSRHHRLVCHLL
jgi:hypothetical protein